MIVKLIISLILTNVFTYCHSQHLAFIKLNESASTKGGLECIYRVEIYNNTNKPFCVPISLAFGYTVSSSDTVEVINTSGGSDTSETFSLYYTKSDLEGSKARYPAIPVLLNPNTYLITNIKFRKAGHKKIYFLKLEYSKDEKLDFYKIFSSYQNEPMFKWMDDLNFTTKNYLIIQ